MRNLACVFIGSSSPSVAVPPASLLPGDRATIGAQAGNCTEPLTTATPTFTPLNAELARREITWSADSAVEWELVRVVLFDAAFGRRRQHHVDVVTARIVQGGE